ncbi:MAG TPA: glutamate synthase subunit beta [Gammaproteobacteria bacterium]|nr:glutamate synthase subunit beta [Gammaproteobacteria bacterium]
MGKPTGFLEIHRKIPANSPIADRLQDFREFTVQLNFKQLSQQGARCMDCGIPFCHYGCPVNNIIPDWNHLVYTKKWHQAIHVLHSTNNFPEFTGRICPAPCEAACTLNIDDNPVTIKNIERAIVDRAWQEGWIKPEIAEQKTGKSVIIVGSGPAGMACAQQLARAGHKVTLVEKNDRIGGLMRYGIPNFKMEKRLIDRRIAQMRAEGVIFRTNVHIGVNRKSSILLEGYDAVVLTGGSEHARDLPVPGRDLRDIYYAMEYLLQQNRRIAGEVIPDDIKISARGKNVIVIGGGDTGSDCIGTANRQKAHSITQLEILPKPPEKENKALSWPEWPQKMRTTTSHEEGCDRDWSVITKSFSGKNGQVKTIQCARLQWHQDTSGGWQMEEIPGSEFELKADLVLLAMGFIHPVHEGMLKDLGVALDARGNVKANTRQYQTSIPNVFAAGDMRRGQSLIVWAIHEGRGCAKAVDEFLMGESNLPD